jgi:hypothetical protein
MWVALRLPTAHRDVTSYTNAHEHSVTLSIIFSPNSEYTNNGFAFASQSYLIFTSIQNLFFSTSYSTPDQPICTNVCKSKYTMRLVYQVALLTASAPCSLQPSLQHSSSRQLSLSRHPLKMSRRSLMHLLLS